ncbi:hypothetical protein [Rhizobium rhizosphaerae]|uniref:hypothetical protein n=1 Tax=Xaviernesmea rhizosphaerae TaxID=1672749 RepID=UPI000AC84B7D|nr:hypothetical protein [Xaviernesmea rhizosphaerae]
MISFLIRIGFFRKPASSRRAAAPACEAQDPLSHPAIARMDARMLADLPFPEYRLSWRSSCNGPEENYGRYQSSRKEITKILCASNTA